MPHAILVRNPASRSTLRDDALAEVVRVAEDAGWRVTSMTTRRPGDATAIARYAATEHADALIVNGGDGTISDAVNGLAHSGTALAVVPGGTVNVWAKEARISKDPVAAMRQAISGERRRIDLGRAGDRYFMLMAGVGFDAGIVARMGSGLKRRLGAWSYLLAAVPAAIRYNARPVQITVDGVAGRTIMYWMVIGNTRLYGGFREITHRARVDDGVLDVAWMRHGGPKHLLGDGVRLLRGAHDRAPNVRYLQAKNIDIETAGLPVQVDGEPHGETPMRFASVPAALTVIVPRGLRTPLFAASTGPSMESKETAERA